MIPTRFIAANPHRLKLNAGEVQLWRLDLEDQPLACDKSMLDATEAARLGRLLAPTTRRWRINCRLTLRYLLGCVLDLAPDEVQLQSGANGRPLLAGDQQQSGLNFNVSHAGPLAVIAIADSSKLGVDIERVRSVDVVGIARRMFHEREREALQALQGAAQAQLFFRLWTAKEALLKAEGTGVFHDPAGWRVKTQESFEVAGNVNPSRDGSNWLLHEFVPQPGVHGMLATGREDWTVRYLQLEPELNHPTEN